MAKRKNIICTKGIIPLDDGFIFLGQFCKTPIFLGKTEEEINKNIKIYNEKCALIQEQHENTIVTPFCGGYIFQNRYFQKPVFLG